LMNSSAVMACAIGITVIVFLLRRERHVW